MFKVECAKCSGTGRIKAFGHVQGGVCFTCNGAGHRMLKNKPNASQTWIVSFLWTDPSDVNYMNGEFCRCGTIKATSYTKALNRAGVQAQSNGAKGYRVELAT